MNVKIVFKLYTKRVTMRGCFIQVVPDGCWVSGENQHNARFCNARDFVLEEAALKYATDHGLVVVEVVR